MLWKIYAGYKKSTKQEAAIFVFEKTQMNKWARKDRENMIEILKKGVNQLTRLKHPRVLTVQHPLEESRYVLYLGYDILQGVLRSYLKTIVNLHCFTGIAWHLQLNPYLPA